MLNVTKKAVKAVEDKIASGEFPAHTDLASAKRSGTNLADQFETDAAIVSLKNAYYVIPLIIAEAGWNDQVVAVMKTSKEKDLFREAADTPTIQMPSEDEDAKKVEESLKEGFLYLLLKRAGGVVTFTKAETMEGSGTVAIAIDFENELITMTLSENETKH